MVDRYSWVSNYGNVSDSALNEHIDEHWNTVHLKRLGYNTSLYLICRLGTILATCLRAGTVWPILRRKWKTLFGSCVNTTGFQMPRKVQHRVQTHSIGTIFGLGVTFLSWAVSLIFVLRASYIHTSMWLCVRVCLCVPLQIAKTELKFHSPETWEIQKAAKDAPWAFG